MNPIMKRRLERYKTNHPITNKPIKPTADLSEVQLLGLLLKEARFTNALITAYIALFLLSAAAMAAWVAWS